MSMLLNQIVDLKQHLNMLEKKYTSIAKKPKTIESILKSIYNEKIQSKSQIGFILEDRQKGEKDLLDILEAYHDHINNLEIKQCNLLSTVNMSNVTIYQLED